MKRQQPRTCSGYAILLIPALLGAMCLPRFAVGAGDNSITGQVATAVATVAAQAQKAAVCVEISLSAVENAMAAQDLAEAELMKAMKSGGKVRIRAAERTLAARSEDAEEARELAKTIIDYAAECSAAATSAKEEESRLNPEMTDKEQASCLKRLNHLVDIARHALKKAEALAETLKKKWLLPIVTTTTTTTTTTTQPPNPTPVGRR